MNEHGIKGKIEELEGLAQAAYGQAIDDDETKARGRFRQAAGKARESFGQAIDQIGDMSLQLREHVREQPLTMLLLAAGVGFLVGRLWPRKAGE
jgi:uncharacterized protein YjbJ (UPF0337 family)